jgi:CheY-like chemotaxis protein
MTEPIRILLIEDNPGDAVLLRETLRDVGGADQFALTHVMRLEEGLQKLASAVFDVVLLDLSLPDGHGLETLSRTHSHAAGTPIVVLTGLNDETLAVRAVQEGAQDYLVKGNVDSSLLARSLRYAIERQRMITQLRKARELERHMANHASSSTTAWARPWPTPGAKANPSPCSSSISTTSSCSMIPSATMSATGS